MYWSPSTPEVRIDAELSVGSSSLRSTSSVTRARKSGVELDRLDLPHLHAADHDAGAVLESADLVEGRDDLEAARSARS